MLIRKISPRTSSKWVPHETFASTMGLKNGTLDEHVVEDVERKGSST
jgi:hypothetical protein